MSEDVYVLKYKLPHEILDYLNDHPGKAGLSKVLRDVVTFKGKDEVLDMVNACWSGKKIVNPMTPREELKKLMDTSYWTEDFVAGVQRAVEVIAKEYPDVADWLKDGDSNA
jgi:hypothetical protein